jgi:hypothetical protein
MKFRSNSLTRRRSCRASTALAARGSPRPAIASRFQASSSAGYSPCSRHQALRTASSIAAVTITASSRAAAVQRWLPPTAPLTSASPRQRSSVATLIPTSRDTRSTDELSGGNSRATIRSLYACPYRATFVFQRPQRFRSYPDGNFSDTGGGLSAVTTLPAIASLALGKEVSVGLTITTMVLAVLSAIFMAFQKNGEYAKTAETHRSTEFNYKHDLANP